jgi:hypothetical protein
VVDPPREVREAFHDVVRAWEDRERLTKEAEGYREDILPKARGEAVQIVQVAEAFREQRLIRAQGDATRFLRVLDEYRKAEAVTRERLYLETMDRVRLRRPSSSWTAGAIEAAWCPAAPARLHAGQRPAPTAIWRRKTNRPACWGPRGTDMSQLVIALLVLGGIVLPRPPT